MVVKSQAKKFFAFARERHSIYLNRKAGWPRPWTNDPILHEHKFTNVYRELDKTTEWFKFNVRDPMSRSPEVLLATVIFRWFNRISSGEAMFQNRLLTRYTPFDDFLQNGDTGVLKASLLSYCGEGPYFTGAYMIRSPDNMSKLDGMLSMVDKFHKESNWRGIATYYMDRPKSQSLEKLWSWLKNFECQGPFHAYEVVTDLRHTKIMDNAYDIMTWGNPGPGCKRGVSRMLEMGDYTTASGRTKLKTPTKDQLDYVMKWLLLASLEEKYWPPEWPRWEMREVEHTLCEWDKYERIRLRQGRMKGKYHE